MFICCLFFLGGGEGGGIKILYLEGETPVLLVVRGLLWPFSRDINPLLYTVSKVLADFAVHVTDDTVARLYVTQSLVK